MFVVFYENCLCRHGTVFVHIFVTCYSIFIFQKKFEKHFCSSFCNFSDERGEDILIPDLYSNTQKCFLNLNFICRRSHLKKYFDKFVVESLKSYIKMFIFSKFTGSRAISTKANFLNTFHWPLGKLFSVTPSYTLWKTL